jgi:hypothetical protein
MWEFAISHAVAENISTYTIIVLSDLLKLVAFKRKE